LSINPLNKLSRSKIEAKFHVILLYKNPKELLPKCLSFLFNKEHFKLVKIVAFKSNSKAPFLVNLNKSLDGNFMDHKEIYK
jgi:hypothetical protein